jgi:RNA polymerase sigma-70 factor (ECF subfamily)
VNIPEAGTHRTIESVARRSYGRLVAFLSARTHDVAGAEDALADALLTALAVWPRDGIPNNPEGWLLTAARRHLIDRSRHERVKAQAALTLGLMADQSSAEETAEGIPDERLKLLFVCAHPSIDPEMHTPLMLQTVLGLDAAGIARAFLVSPAAMSQRLVRAKTKIRLAGVEWEVPEKADLPPRLEAVLNAIYAAYGSGWEDAAGADPRTRGLAEEAIWLARVLREQVPEEPEVHGLLALMLHCEARRTARRSVGGEFVPLSAQDPALWDPAMIAEAERELAIAAAAARPGRFQLEAAIQSVYAERARTGRIDWHAVAVFYSRLVQLSPTLGALIGRAAAIAEVSGPQAGLSLLDEMDTRKVGGYQPYWAVRAHLLQKLNRRHEAFDAFDRAIDLAEDEAARRFLLERRGS